MSKTPSPSTRRGLRVVGGSSGPDGGFFVLRSADGAYWNGKKWLADVRKARRFASGPDPWNDARQAADSLPVGGLPCEVVWFPYGPTVT